MDKIELKKNHYLLPTIALIIGAALGGSSGLYIKSVGLSSYAVSGFRMGIPLLILLPSVIKRNTWRGPIGHRRQLWLASFLNALRLILYVTAFKLTTMGNAIVLLYLWPIFAILVQSVLDKRRPRLFQILILLGAFAGVIIMNLHRDLSLSGANFLGTLAMTGSALLLSINTLIFKSALKETNEADTIFYQNALGAIIFIPFLLMEWGSTPVIELGLGAFYGLAVGIVGFGCFFYALKRLPLFQYSTIAYIEVFFGVFLGVVFLSEQLSWNMILGAIMVIAMSLWAALPEKV